MALLATKVWKKIWRECRADPCTAQPRSALRGWLKYGIDGKSQSEQLVLSVMANMLLQVVGDGKKRLSLLWPAHVVRDGTKRLSLLLQAGTVRTNIVPAGSGIRGSKARQGKARQGKARQGKARQGKARQGKAGQGRARQGKARQANFLQFDWS